MGQGGYEILPGGTFTDNNENGYYGGTTYYKADNRAKGFDVYIGDWPMRPSLNNATMILENSVIWTNNEYKVRLHTIKYGFIIENNIKTNILPMTLKINDISNEHLNYLPKGTNY